ncbi:hypothetical protein ACFXHA_44555 [Nocardia sp. NPDC059240]|uniref:hypothetical protein n=1 Tax=Nocardia sp. NPDC059240 TaxID=3346786 RepID=UPI0036905062
MTAIMAGTAVAVTACGSSDGKSDQKTTSSSSAPAVSTTTTAGTVPTSAVRPSPSSTSGPVQPPVTSKPAGEADHRAGDPCPYDAMVTGQWQWTGVKWVCVPVTSPGGEQPGNGGGMGGGQPDNGGGMGGGQPDNGGGMGGGQPGGVPTTQPDGGGMGGGQPTDGMNGGQG